MEREARYRYQPAERLYMLFCGNPDERSVPRIQSVIYKEYVGRGHSMVMGDRMYYPGMWQLARTEEELLPELIRALEQRIRETEHWGNMLKEYLERQEAKQQLSEEGE